MGHLPRLRIDPWLSLGDWSEGDLLLRAVAGPVPSRPDRRSAPCCHTCLCTCRTALSRNALRTSTSSVRVGLSSIKALFQGLIKEALHVIMHVPAHNTLQRLRPWQKLPDTIFKPLQQSMQNVQGRLHVHVLYSTNTSVTAPLQQQHHARHALKRCQSRNISTASEHTITFLTKTPFRISIRYKDHIPGHKGSICHCNGT